MFLREILEKILYYVRAQSLLVLLCCSLLISCASGFGKEFQNVTIKSSPEEASVYFNGDFVGKTPVTIVVPIRRTDNEIEYMKKRLEDDDITQEEFLDYKNLIHRIVVTKEGEGTKQIFITPKLYHKNAPNRGLCIFDAIYSPIFLFMPVIADIANSYCYGFDRVYNIQLGNRGILYQGKSSYTSSLQ